MSVLEEHHAKGSDVLGCQLVKAEHCHCQDPQAHHMSPRKMLESQGFVVSRNAFDADAAGEAVYDRAAYALRCKGVRKPSISLKELGRG